MNKNYLITVAGPTAIGKTALAIQLAKHFRTEIISADSRQFYKEMQIGTAVPSPEELAEVPHHFIQHKSMFDSYSVGDFERDAIAKLHRLFKTRNVVLMAGGSGLYIDAVLNGLDTFPDIPPELRETLNHTLEQEGLETLQNKLLQTDPDYFKQADIQNPQRVIRALEVSLATGRPYSSFLKKKETHRPFHSILIGLTAPRELIYDRINRRVEEMMQQGLEAEAGKLYPHRRLNALQTVGYKELFARFEGIYSREEAISEIKKNTRRFAKRQLTWFRRNKNILWVHLPVTIDVLFSELQSRMQ